MSTTAKPQRTSTATAPDTRSQPMLNGRHADSARRRQRVITALDQAITEGAEISASGIARAAGVDRTFLYRHRDLLEKIHALQAEPAVSDRAGPAVTRALNQKITHFEQQAADLRLQLEERDDDLAAARATNRELMTQLNHAAQSR